MINFSLLRDLDHSSLIRLAEALESGQLTPPFTGLSLQPHIADAHIAAVSTFLGELSQCQMSPSKIALVFRSMEAGRQVNPEVTEMIDVVVSGPDVAAVYRDTGVVIRQLFNKVQKQVLAVGYAVYQGQSVFKDLADRLDDDSSIEATLCLEVRREHSDTSLDSQVVDRFAKDFVEKEWPGTRLPRIYYDPRSLSNTSSEHSALHAKCVVIDGREALVTSANFTEAAQERNIELGLLVDSSVIARRIEEHFFSLIRNDHLKRLPLPS